MRIVVLSPILLLLSDQQWIVKIDTGSMTLFEWSWVRRIFIAKSQKGALSKYLQSPFEQMHVYSLRDEQITHS